MPMVTFGGVLLFPHKYQAEEGEANGWNGWNTDVGEASTSESMGPARTDNADLLLVPPNLRSQMRVPRRSEFCCIDQIRAGEFVARLKDTPPEVEYPAVVHDRTTTKAYARFTVWSRSADAFVAEEPAQRGTIRVAAMHLIA